jgi:hypothetical protein
VRTRILFFALLGLLGLGVAVAVGDVTTSTAVSCTTTTSPTHVHADVWDGVTESTKTVGGDTLEVCATATATATDQTVTTTETVTTTAPTTTAATTTTSAPTFASETAYTQNRPAFTPTRTVNVSTGAALKTALSGLAAGDLVQASAPFTVSSTTCTNILINKNLATWAEIDLTGVSIVYTGTSDCAGVQITAASHIRVFGGDISTSDVGGDCINDHGSNNVLWWGFTAHDCGKDGIAIIAATDGGGAPDHLDFQGTITKAGQNLNRDPHLEKGTGIHGVLLWDGGASLPFTNNRLAFDVENQKSGACVEFGQSPGSSTPSSGNTMYLKCNGNPCKASSQTCGNGLQLWGQTSNLSLDVKYIEVDNYAGYPTYGQAISSGQNAAGVTVEYGRATNDKTNPYPSLSYLWDNIDGIVYQDVQPAP